MNAAVDTAPLIYLIGPLAITQQLKLGLGGRRVALESETIVETLFRADSTELRVAFVEVSLLEDSTVQSQLNAPGQELLRVIGVVNDANADSAPPAFDYIASPPSRAEVEFRFARALRDLQVELAAKSDRSALARKPRKSDILIGQGPWIRKLYDQLAMAAPTDVTVAIFGASGTGKELVARTLHSLSRRFLEPFVAVNCAAIPEALLEDELFGHVRGAFTDATRDREGLFSAADRGTIFLDEIGEMSLALQAKLLRVLQTQEFRRVGDDINRQVDVRVVTATNKDLQAEVRAGRFREDLFYRINVFTLALPALRERKDDIPLLAHHFLNAYRDRVGKELQGFSSEAMRALLGYSFPGNVRELENKVHQAMILARGTEVELEDLQGIGPAQSDGSTIDLGQPFRELKRGVVNRFEHEYLDKLLRQERGNIAAAARVAGMDRKNLWALLQKHGLDARLYRG